MRESERAKETERDREVGRAQLPVQSCTKLTSGPDAFLGNCSSNSKVTVKISYSQIYNGGRTIIGVTWETKKIDGHT